MIHELNYFKSSLLHVSSGTRHLCRRWHHIIPELWFLPTKVNGVTTREHRNFIIVDIYSNFWREVVHFKWGLRDRPPSIKAVPTFLFAYHEIKTEILISGLQLMLGSSNDHFK